MSPDTAICVVMDVDGTHDDDDEDDDDDGDDHPDDGVDGEYGDDEDGDREGPATEYKWICWRFFKVMVSSNFNSVVGDEASHIFCSQSISIIFTEIVILRSSHTNLML